MKISEYRKAAGLYLKGRKCEAFFVTSACLFVFLTFKTASAFIAGAFAGMRISPYFDAGITILSFIFMTPLLTGAFWWFFRIACGEDNNGLLKLYSGFRLNSRAAIIYALMWSKSFFSLVPSAACFTAAYIIFFGNVIIDDSMALFVVFQLDMLGFVLVGLYFRTLASMALAPFLFICYPDRNPFGIIRRSAKLMKGEKLRFVGLLFGYLPIMLPIVTIPFAVPSAAMAAAVFAEDVITRGNTENG